MNEIRARPVYTTMGVYYLIFRNGNFVQSCDASELQKVLEELTK